MATIPSSADIGKQIAALSAGDRDILEARLKERQAQNPSVGQQIGRAAMGGIRGAASAFGVDVEAIAPSKKETSDFTNFIIQEQIRNTLDPTRRKAALEEGALLRPSVPPVTPGTQIDTSTQDVIQPTSEEPERGILEQPEDTIQPTEGAAQFTPEGKLVKGGAEVPQFTTANKWQTDKLGNSRLVPTSVPNEEFIEALRKKKSLNDNEVALLKKADETNQANQMNFDAIEGLSQNMVATWKAAAQEKKGIPPFIAKATGPVSEALSLRGFSWTKAYVGQRIETAMALSKIITGGSRIIRSVINQLLQTFPVDDTIVEDMESKIFQTLANSFTRAKGHALNDDERAEIRDRIANVLRTEAATVPQLEEGQLEKLTRESRNIEVNGVLYDIPHDEFLDFINSWPEDAIIIDREGE